MVLRVSFGSDHQVLPERGQNQVMINLPRRYSIKLYYSTIVKKFNYDSILTSSNATGSFPVITFKMEFSNLENPINGIQYLMLTPLGDRSGVGRNNYLQSRIQSPRKRTNQRVSRTLFCRLPPTIFELPSLAATDPDCRAKLFFI